MRKSSHGYKKNFMEVMCTTYKICYGACHINLFCETFKIYIDYSHFCCKQNPSGEVKEILSLCTNDCSTKTEPVEVDYGYTIIGNLLYIIFF